MGANFCGFRRRPCPNRSAEKDSENGNCGLTTSVIKFMKPRSIWAAFKVKKTPFHLQEKQELQLYKNNCKVLTLEDWIISSPGFSKTDYTTTSGGETPAHKQCSSRKIHPSFDFDGDLTVEISVRTGEASSGQAESENATVCRTKSGKMKKKVSFRSPVADIFVLDH